MNKQVLVAYATKYGGTAEIAEKIGQVLEGAELHTDVLPVSSVSDLARYQAVVLGSAVYLGQWRREAVRFVKANETLLSERPLWLFSSGPSGEGDPVKLLDGWRFPQALAPFLDRILPRDIAVFHGVVKLEKLNMVERWMVKNIKSPVGDFRDWNTISSWARAIADDLKESVLR
jgi:menaquinone-dependent protoporphyrinogen oxidase